MAAASAVQFDIRDEKGATLPCKAQFLALEGTDPVNLGPEQRAHGCRDQYHSERGRFPRAAPARRATASSSRAASSIRTSRRR